MFEKLLSKFKKDKKAPKGKKQAPAKAVARKRGRYRCRRLQ